MALGGLGTPWASLAGGLVFAFAEVFGPLFPGFGHGPQIGFGLDIAIAFVVLVLVLIVRPNGLLGKPFYS